MKLPEFNLFSDKSARIFGGSCPPRPLSRTPMPLTGSSLIISSLKRSKFFSKSSGKLYLSSSVDEDI